jgi:hypothetical protein
MVGITMGTIRLLLCFKDYQIRGLHPISNQNKGRPNCRVLIFKVLN